MQRIVGAVSVHMKAGAPAKTHSCYRHHLSQTSASNAFLVIQTGVGLAYFNVVVTCQGKEEGIRRAKEGDLAIGGGNFRSFAVFQEAFQMAGMFADLTERLQS